VDRLYSLHHIALSFSPKLLFAGSVILDAFASLELCAAYLFNSDNLLPDVGSLFVIFFYSFVGLIVCENVTFVRFVLTA